MTYAFDPKRLAELDGNGRPSHDLGAAIRALRGWGASASEIESLARRLAPQLSAPAAAGAGGAVLGASVNAKWIGGALFIAAAFGAYAWLHAGAHVAPAPRRQPHAASAAAVHAPASPAAPAASPSPAPAPTAVGVDVARPVAPVAHARRRRPSPPAERIAPAASADPQAELALLQRAQASLDRDASGALALAERHARDYPHGLFTQEREILAIEALLKLRQRPAALARATEFAQRYPNSPHARRVRALLERAPRVPAPTTAPASDHSSMDDH
jgi:hypothetical protein